MAESRNAKARVASKTRRDNEAVEFQELTDLLPLPQEVKENLDKESIVRMIIGFMRLRQYLQQDQDSDSSRRRCLTYYPPGYSDPASRSQDLPGARRHLGSAGPGGAGGGVDYPLSLPSSEVEPQTAPVATSSGVSSSASLPVRAGGEEGGTLTGSQADGGNSGGPAWFAGIEEGQLLLEALQGFLLLINKKGKVLYVSTNVEEYLGTSQAWMLERHIGEFIHHDDLRELTKNFDLRAKRAAVFPQPSDNTQRPSTSGYTYDTSRNFYLRMRHFPNGAGSRKKAGNYLVVQWTGELRVRWSSHAGPSRPRCTGMVCVCRPLQSQAILHIPLGGSMFISRHDMRLTYTYCDPRVLFLIGYEPSYLIGRTVYQFHNPVDAHKCSECHSSLLQTGSGVSAYYRFLGRTGVWVWMQTKATIVCDTQGQPQYVVCNNYIISEKEAERSHQMELQQQGQGHTLQAVPAADLTARGAIDLQPLSQVTSPVSSTDSEHDQLDDTGYNSAVSSIGSASASPCPVNALGGMGTGGGGGMDANTSSLNVFPVPKQGLGFHSTLSAAIYGEDFGVHDMPVSMPSLPGSYSSDGILQEIGNLDPTSASLSDEQSDPFLCSGSTGDGHSEGSGANVMEDMDLLEDLLGRISDCDNSQDSVFASSTTPTHQQRDSSSSSALAGKGQETLLPRKGASHLTVGSHGVLRDSPELHQQQQQHQHHHHHQQQQHPSLLETGAVDSQRQPPSLLRSLLNKEGDAMSEGPSLSDLWTKFPPTSLSSRKLDAGSLSAACSPADKSGGEGKVSFPPPPPLAAAPPGSNGEVSLGAAASARQRENRSDKQLVVYGGKQRLVPREVDLTLDDSGEGSEGEEERGLGMDSDNLPPTLPDDLLDFAMQYCDTLTDMDVALPEGMTGLEADDWTAVDDLIPADTQVPTVSPSEGEPGKDAPKKCVDVPVRTASVEPGSQKQQCEGKQQGFPVSSKVSSFPAGTQQQASPVTSASSPAIQSAIITSTKDTKRGITISLRNIPTAGLKGIVIEPAGNGKTMATLKCTGPVTSGVVKCVRLISPALSDHRYSSSPLSQSSSSSSSSSLSPDSQLPRAQSPGGIQPPCGKRMRTERDGRAGDGKETGAAGGGGVVVGGGGSGAKGPTLLHRVIQSFPLPKTSSQPAQVAGKQISSPTSGRRSPRKGSSAESSPASQPTSPFPNPIPANGGGKPLTAMSELEKHLRGLVAPPDERQNEPDDILTPVDECSQTGSRPFLERLLTGEISHERYRQIDYHLLYQERERRLSENGQFS